MDEAISLIAKNPIPLFLATLLVFLLEIPVVMVLGSMDKSASVPTPRGVTKKAWLELVSSPGQPGASWLGRIERILFFAALLLSAPELVVGWLVFKVGSKWQVWQHVIRVPDRLGRSTTEDYFVSRNAWGALVFQRFLFGTGANIVAALLGVATFHLLSTWCA